MENREIKFRAWYKKLMIYDVAFMPNGNKDWEYMQYTGIKDKSGKEIYERDIYQIGDFIGVVKYMKFIRNISNSDLRKMEVIGNIHENFELIKDNKMWKEPTLLGDPHYPH